jgi:putative transposase
MTRKRHTEEQIIGVPKDAQAGIGVPEDAQAGIGVPELCRKHGISDATFYQGRAKYAGLEVSDVKKLRQLEDENRRLKQMGAEQALDIQALKAGTTKKTGRAQGETNGGPMDGRSLWAESATSLSVSRPGSEHLARPWSPPGGFRPAETDS